MDKMENEPLNRIAEELLDDCRTMLPRMMLSLRSEIMDCRVAWCRFVKSSNENIARREHRHLVYEMHFILAGEIIYNFPELGIDSFHANAGQFILIPEGTLHTTSDGAKGITEYLVIAFSLFSENDTINVIFSKDSRPLNLPFSVTIISLIEALHCKRNDVNFTNSLSTKLIIHSILLEAVDCMAASKGLHYLPERQGAHEDARVDNVIRIVSENIYNDKLNGDFVAEQIGLTTRQLNRICNKNFGCSIKGLITKVRIDSIKAVLETSEHSLADIAEIFGFCDVYAFIRHFSHFAGVTPGAYRKEYILHNSKE